MLKPPKSTIKKKEKSARNAEPELDSSLKKNRARFPTNNIIFPTGQLSQLPVRQTSTGDGLCAVVVIVRNAISNRSSCTGIYISCVYM